jgi:hypothetical protein
MAGSCILICSWTVRVVNKNLKRASGRIRRELKVRTPPAMSRLLNKVAWAAAPKWSYALSAVERSHLWPERGRVMQRVLQEYFNGPTSLLEIGTWFGEGSTPIWLETLAPGSKLVLLDAWRPYLSKEDHDQGLPHYRAMDLLPFAAWHNVARRTFSYQESGGKINITTIRGDSAWCLPLLAPQSFDIVFVDGSHYYGDIRLDLVQALRLAKSDFSLICGDDLELTPTEELVALCRGKLAHDTIDTPHGPVHPGVLVAVDEVLGEVNQEDGFWWTFMSAGALDPNAHPRARPEGVRLTAVDESDTGQMGDQDVC